MIRPAKNVDIFRIVELMQDMNAASKYAELDEVDEPYARRLLAQCIQRHGHSHDGGAVVYVSVADSKVEGFFIGILDRLYNIGTKLSANDVLLYASKRAPKADMMAMIDAYLAWATNNPLVATVKFSWTDAIPGAERMVALYKRKGFTKVGEIFERTLVNDMAQEAA